MAGFFPQRGVPDTFVARWKREGLGHSYLFLPDLSIHHGSRRLVRRGWTAGSIPFAPSGTRGRHELSARSADVSDSRRESRSARAPTPAAVEPGVRAQRRLGPWRWTRPPSQRPPP